MATFARNPTVIAAATLAVAALGVWGALNSYLVSQSYAQQAPDVYGGEHALTRFAALNGRVPASGELGYITDLDPSASAYASAMLTAQYAVAPHVLVRPDAQKRPEFAVGNFSRPSNFAAIGEAHGYAFVEDLGSGVVLYHRL